MMKTEELEWIKQKTKEWQFVWHDAYDRDKNILERGGFDRPDSVPNDLMRDRRLNFGLTTIDYTTRVKCFSVLPCGTQMLQRLENYLNESRLNKNFDQAKEMVIEISVLINATKYGDGVNWKDVELINPKSEEGRKLLLLSDPIFYLLEDSVFETYTDEVLLADAAAQFLREALYVSAGGYYELGHWVIGPLVKPELDAVQSGIYELWRSGWQLTLTNKRIALVDKRELLKA